MRLNALKSGGSGWTRPRTPRSNHGSPQSHRSNNVLFCWSIRRQHTGTARPTGRKSAREDAWQWSGAAAPAWGRGCLDPSWVVVKLYSWFGFLKKAGFRRVPSVLCPDSSILPFVLMRMNSDSSVSPRLLFPRFTVLVTGQGEFG
jgi:hypothetical protein